MTDHYVWIDSFAEIERANARAAYAREQGRNDVLDHEYRQPGLLRRAIEDQAYRIAERVVEEQIRPHLADAAMRKRVQGATLELLAFTPMKYVLTRVDDRLSAAPVYDSAERSFGVVTEVQMKPFSYAAMDRFA